MLAKSPLPPGYLDLKSLGLYASCSVRWLRSRLNDPINPLPHYRVTGKLLIRVDEFERWMSAHRARPHPEQLKAIVDDVFSSLCRRSA
jgi:hypothetical protein